MGENMIQTIQIDESTWRIEDGFVRFFLLEGDNKAALIDSGVSCANAKEIAENFTDKPLILINTHGDGDHISGTGNFTEIYMHPCDYKECGVGAKYPNTILKELNDNDLIELGNRPLKVVHIPGHTKGSVAILDVKNRALYAGDSVQKGHIYMFGSHRDPEQFETSLNKLIEMGNEYDVIYASHDEYKLPGDYAKRVLEAWKQVRSGKVSYENENLFGNEVKAYTIDACGFFME